MDILRKAIGSCIYSDSFEEALPTREQVGGIGRSEITPPGILGGLLSRSSMSSRLPERHGSQSSESSELGKMKQMQADGEKYMLAQLDLEKLPPPDQETRSHAELKAKRRENYELRKSRADTSKKIENQREELRRKMQQGHADLLKRLDNRKKNCE